MTEPVHIPIDGNLDLHTFDPRDLPDLLDDYLNACAEHGILSVRVIHGKGTGQLKRRVQSLLARHPLVVSFSDAPPNAGGWGATVATLAVQRKE